MSEEQKSAPGTSVVNIEEQLRKQLQGLNERVGAPPSNKISTKGKVFTLPGGESNTSLQVIILDWRHALAHYPGAYDASNPQDPDCFAIGVHEPMSGQLVPHESIEKPHGKDCSSCSKNQWKSAANGKGKACKNQIRLLVVGVNADEESRPLTLYISPGALKTWNAYITDLARIHNLDVIQVVTEITFDPNETYPKLQFKMADKHGILAVAWALKNRYQEMADRPIEMKQKKAA
jgi:hypothetical protein